MFETSASIKEISIEDAANLDACLLAMVHFQNSMQTQIQIEINLRQEIDSLKKQNAKLLEFIKTKDEVKLAE